MAEFYEWPGWDAVGAIASVLALATFLIGFFEIVRRRRQIQPVVFGWDVVGKVTKKNRPEQWHYVVEFRNSGAGVAYIRQLNLVHARGIASAAHRPLKTLGRGESFTLLVQSDDLEKAWFRLEWREERDRRRYQVRWYPLIWQSNGTPGSSMTDMYRTHWSRSWIGLRWSRAVSYWKPRSVSPHASFSATYTDRRWRVWPLPNPRERKTTVRSGLPEGAWSAFVVPRLERLPEMSG